jgi:hypothetical protein
LEHRRALFAFYTTILQVVHSLAKLGSREFHAAEGVEDEQVFDLNGWQRPAREHRINSGQG